MNINEQRMAQSMQATLESIQQQQKQIIHLLEEQLYVACCAGAETPDLFFMQERAKELKKAIGDRNLAAAFDISQMQLGQR